jgi:hypothetical protein
MKKNNNDIIIQYNNHRMILILILILILNGLNGLNGFWIVDCESKVVSRRTSYLFYYTRLHVDNDRMIVVGRKNLRTSNEKVGRGRVDHTNESGMRVRCGVRSVKRNEKLKVKIHLHC